MNLLNWFKVCFVFLLFWVAARVDVMEVVFVFYCLYFCFLFVFFLFFF